MKNKQDSLLSNAGGVSAVGAETTPTRGKAAVSLNCQIPLNTSTWMDATDTTSSSLDLYSHTCLSVQVRYLTIDARQARSTHVSAAVSWNLLVVKASAAHGCLATANTTRAQAPVRFERRESGSSRVSRCELWTLHVFKIVCILPHIDVSGLRPGYPFTLEPSLP